MNVFIADKFEKAGIEGLRSIGCSVESQPDVTADALGGALASVDPAVLVVRSKKVSRAAIASGRSLRCIVRAGAGFDNIDLSAASERGIGVCNCPGMNAVAVAELVFGLLLCCDRRLPDQVAELRAGAWNKKEYSRARGLCGQTLGVIGVGSIGREVIRRAKAFGMHVIAHSLNMTKDRADDLGVAFGGSSRADLHDLAARSDAVSVHVAANPESEKMCDGAFFDALRGGAYFVNTSRGSVVDEAALRRAVTEKGIRVGLDVYQGEPSEGARPWTWDLASLHGVYGTHHCGASTDQAQNAVADEVVRIVRVFKSTGQFENRVNKPPVTVVGSGAAARA